MFDHKQRKFTLLHPIHMDLFGGIVKIIATASPVVSKGIATPLIGLRWQSDDPTSRIDEMHYTIDGVWCFSDGKVHGFDLWDADLISIKPQQRVDLKVISNG